MAKENTKNTGKKEKPRRPWNKINMTAEEFDDLSNEYFQKCIETGVRPSIHLLARHCGISTDTYKRWEKNEDKRHSKHAAVIKKNFDMFCGLLQQEDKAMAVFMLKQPCYGGFSDKQETNENNHKITIDILSNGTKIT